LIFSYLRVTIKENEGNKVKACAFFGSSKGNYNDLKERMRAEICRLIEREGVSQFYSGGRGNFDLLCATIVGELKERFPQIKNTLVFSYLPQETYELPAIYTDTVYLLERKVPPRYAILETNKKIVEKSDIIFTATRQSYGGARKAREYAEEKRKRIIEAESL
jgi:hypothetical protein